jgi:uncharacterized membrane protein YidH (DUF202 family)
MVDRSPQPTEDDGTKAHQRRPLAWRLTAIGLFSLGVLVALLLACVLWTPRSLYPSLAETELRAA